MSSVTDTFWVFGRSVTDKFWHNWLVFRADAEAVEHEEVWFFQEGIEQSDVDQVKIAIGIDSDLSHSKQLADALHESLNEFPDVRCCRKWERLRHWQCFIPSIRSPARPDPTDDCWCFPSVSDARSLVLWLAGLCLYTLDDIFLDNKIWWDAALTCALAILFAIVQCCISTSDVTCLCPVRRCCKRCLCLCTCHCCCKKCVDEHREPKTGNCRCICARYETGHRTPWTCFRFSRVLFSIFMSGACVTIADIFGQNLPHYANVGLQIVIFPLGVPVFKTLSDVCNSLCRKYYPKCCYKFCPD